MTNLKDLNDNELKETVQNTIKKQMIDTKYNDESISFGQAVVTHHYFLQQQMLANQNMDPAQYYQQQQQTLQNRTTTPLQMLESIQNADQYQGMQQEIVGQIGRDERSRSPHQLVQFDLAQQQHVPYSEMSSAQMRGFKGFGARKSPRDDCKDVKDALVWREPDYEYQEKKFGRPLTMGDSIGRQRKTAAQVQQIQMQRSPQKWKTMYRDQYRKFRESPQRDDFADNDQDGDALQPEIIEDYRISDKEKGERQSVGQSDMNRSYKQRIATQEIGSGIADNRSAHNVDIQDATSPPAIHDRNVYVPDARKRGVQIIEEKDSLPKKKREKPMTAEEKALKAKISEINSTTRWLADSAFTTYFGKPAFHAYGKGNTAPTNQTQAYLTHNINGATGKQKGEFAQVYNSALISGLEKTKGVRVPKLPKQKEKFLQEKKIEGNALLPKTVKDQKKEIKKSVPIKKGISIKITKPRLTIDGFKMDAPTPTKKEEQPKKTKGKANRSISRGDENSEMLSKKSLQQSSMLHNGRGLDESLRDSRGRSQGRNGAEQVRDQAQDMDVGNQDLYDDPLDQNQDDIIQDTQEDENVEQFRPSDEMYDDDHYVSGSPGGENPCSCMQHIDPDYSLAPDEKNPRNYGLMPSCYTRKIAPAGRITYKSESAKNVLFGA